MRRPAKIVSMYFRLNDWRRFASLRIGRFCACTVSIFTSIIAACSAASAQSAACSAADYSGAALSVCKFSASADIRLFLNDGEGEPYRHFSKLEEALTARGEKLVFAMNAGMYHRDLSPVGLYVEEGEAVSPINTKKGPGNFHMLPNGVFWLWAEDGARGAHVSKAETFEKSAQDVVRYATQSGPMLVIDGALHPRFIPGSDSLKRRNGVGVTENGDVYFVLADTPINFHDFAVFFRDELNTPNALYLDGTISRIYAPELERNDPGAAMGPIIAVVEPVGGAAQGNGRPPWP